MVGGEGIAGGCGVEGLKPAIRNVMLSLSKHDLGAAPRIMLRKAQHDIVDFYNFD
jgi:hypothetical protein